MQPKLREVKFIPKRVKVIYNLQAPTDGQLMTFHEEVSNEREGELVLEVRAGIFGPATSLPDTHVVIKHIQKILMTEDSPYRICGMMNAIMTIRADKQVIEEAISYVREHEASIYYVNEVIKDYIQSFFREPMASIYLAGIK
ncbi:MAG: hypothetical protein L6M37_06075 [Candidatus Methylarchaceae archaeon HK02M1]|nr:hypothetical protein [Candidatus Methylarchaceae archaeon HK02M1]